MPVYSLASQDASASGFWSRRSDMCLVGLGTDTWPQRDPCMIIFQYSTCHSAAAGRRRNSCAPSRLDRHDACFYGGDVPQRPTEKDCGGAHPSLGGALNARGLGECSKGGEKVLLASLHRHAPVASVGDATYDFLDPCRLDQGHGIPASCWACMHACMQAEPGLYWHVQCWTVSTAAFPCSLMCLCARMPHGVLKAVSMHSFCTSCKLRWCLQGKKICRAWVWSRAATGLPALSGWSVVRVKLVPNHSNHERGSSCKPLQMPRHVRHK